MAVSPLHPAAAVAAAPAPTPATPVAVDSAVVITPVGNATDSSGARDTGSDPSQQQPQSVEKALEDINEQMKAWSTQLQFEVDPDINRVGVSVVDSKTGDVVRTIPSDAVLRIAKMIVKLQGNAVETSA